ncbi:MAG TPA: hypothetical protein PKE49_06770 [Leptospiraceae bacterium]|nr:hypothetical protein [Leptospirales bacterium]HMW60898.1 hypothetical protein [Leptospiraceae bacterium]HMX56208.1 hypothetical protein [Leptospiraceae bacterium]HMY45380.1 hypothetical protein [Leptospiraceae bacterium]HMZ36819.1 hypothetical protein [Leptospiraceae bacterium]
MILDFLFPERCVVCSIEGQSLCGSHSLSSYVIDPVNRCPVCFVHRGPQGCPKCAGQDIYFSYHSSIYDYRGAVRDLIHRWKFENERSVFKVFLPELTRRLGRMNADRIGVIGSDLRTRSFAHSLDLLRAGKGAGLCGGVDFIKKRIGKKHKQSQRNQAGRYFEIRGSLECVRDLSLVKHYVLLDDVFTTGATANEAARMARIAGAEKVSVLTVAMREDLEHV